MLANNFNEFIVAMNFTQDEFSEWKSIEESEQKSKTQTIDITNYTQHSNHSNSSSHSDRNSHNDHTNGYEHDDHRQWIGHANNTGHTNTHSDEHQNWSEGVKPAHNNHYDTESDYNIHLNEPAHGDKHTQTHGDDHYDRSHRNRTNHSDATPHTNKAFDHENYVPYRPNINIKGSDKVRSTIDLFIYSYDGNNDGLGTQDGDAFGLADISKEVKYYMKIRKIKNLDGTSSVSSWKQLLNGSTTESISFNTIDPLGTGNTDPKATEGIYEIEVYSKNDTISMNGKTKNYISSTRTVTFTIQQNNDPIITVENGDEFIDVAFGVDGAVDENNIFTKYIDGLYQDASESQKEGIFVKLSLHDEDETNAHKGTVYLSDSGTRITSKQDITFTGTGKDKIGVAFIPKSEYMNDGGIENVEVVVDVKDYIDSSFLEEAGAHLIQKKTSTSGENMIVDIDNNYPNIFMTDPSDKWVQSQEITIMLSDPNGLGIRSREYQLVEAGSPYEETGWGMSNQDTFTLNLKNYGEYDLYVKTTDEAGNLTIEKSISAYKIAPIETIITTNPEYPDFIPATEEIYVNVNTICEVDVTEVKMYLQGKESDVYDLSTSDTGDNKTWDGYLPIPEDVVDSDYNIFVESYRYDGGTPKVDTKTIKVFTPIMLSMVGTPVFEAGEDLTFTAKTTKYPETTEAKLFVGTPYETNWLNMDEIIVDQHKEWEYTIPIPADIDKQNYNMTVRSTLPNGKVETISSALIYTDIDASINHTPEWENNRQEYNISQTGDPNSPRSYDTYFSGEKFMLDYSIEMADTTVNPTGVDVEIEGTEYSTSLSTVDSINWEGELWDESMIGKWGQETPEELKFIFTAYFDIMDLDGNPVFIEKEVFITVDDIDGYWELHRKY